MTDDDDEDSVGGGCGCLGCFTTILIIIAFWALLFGVTIDGKHYGISECSCEKGVEIDTGTEGPVKR